MSGGICEEEGREMMVMGLIEGLRKEVGMEQGVEMKGLIKLEMEGCIG